MCFMSCRVCSDLLLSSLTSPFSLSPPPPSLIQLVLRGLVEQDIALSLLTDMLARVIQADSQVEGRPYLTVVLSFARHHAEDLAGVLPRKQQLLLSKYSIELPNAAVHLHVYSFLYM